jgi:hypothetical protein
MRMRQKPDVGWKIFVGVAGLVGGFLTRKSLEYAWTKSTGKRPPVSPESPEVTLREALGWSVLIGVSMEVTRVLISRAAVKRWEATTGSLPLHLLKETPLAD